MPDLDDISQQLADLGVDPTVLLAPQPHLDLAGPDTPAYLTAERRGQLVALLNRWIELTSAAPEGGWLDPDQALPPPVG